MKIIIFLVLAGLSLAEDLNCPEPQTPKDKQECTLQALMELSNFTKTLQIFICEYRGTLKDNAENHHKAANDFLRMMACFGCSADELFGIKNATFEEILKDTGNFAGVILIIANNITDTLGLTETTLKLVCKLAGDALASQCLGDILKEDVAKALYNLNELFCEHDLDKLTADQIIDLMNNMGCFVSDALHHKGLLKEFFKSLGEDLRPGLIDFLKILKDLLVRNGLASKLICDLTKVLLGEKPIIDLGGLGGGGGIIGR